MDSISSTELVKTTAMATIDSSELRGLLEDLPQELYDLVYELTFTAPQTSEQDLTTKIGSAEYVHHLKLLRVNSTSRTQYGKSYFATRTFLVGRNCITWLASLSVKHREQLSSYEVLAQGLCPHSYLTRISGSGLHDILTRSFKGRAAASVGHGVASVLRMRFLCDPAKPRCIPQD
ncbi:hypothetical protein TI39_contig5891g00003 [Zymoseptoria brevis]|uniref:Uncharacterized protein n=1 Tax=Zymoseptoria brevis TaxID=1047168 RepID=A0A0F4G4I4_9PEZI|nr:hypothetical protein TI39_contig5891g00003 [Zymoseptoria brevis]